MSTAIASQIERYSKRLERLEEDVASAGVELRTALEQISEAQSAMDRARERYQAASVAFSKAQDRSTTAKEAAAACRRRLVELMQEDVEPSQQLLPGQGVTF